jgi:hypothetical protein
MLTIQAQTGKITPVKKPTTTKAKAIVKPTETEGIFVTITKGNIEFEPAYRKNTVTVQILATLSRRKNTFVKPKPKGKPFF